MTGLDTNLLVRFLVRDDEKQAKIVYQRFKQAERERETFFVSFPVVLEILWVLDSAYAMSRNEILDALSDLVGLPILAFENEGVVLELIDQGRLCSTDLSDLFIGLVGQAFGVGETLTFDRKAAKHPLFRLLS